MYNSMVELINRSGKVVRITVDEPGDGDVAGIVLLAPPFGATAHSMFAFAHALTVNGYRVARVDYTDHVGLSEGVIADAALPSQLDDLKVAVEAFPDAILVGVSLSSRISVKLLAHQSAVRSAVLITPVINVRHTLKQALDDDYFGMSEKQLPISLEVFTHPISGSFVTRSRDAGYFDLADGKRDLAAVRVPCRLIAGEHDPWVSVEDLESAVAGLDRHLVRLVKVAAGTHKLNRNPAVARVYIETMLEELFDLGRRQGRPMVPSMDQSIRAMSAARPQRSRLPATAEGRM